MTSAYINYPAPHVTLHTDPSCRQIRKRRKPNQRHFQVDNASFSKEVEHLSTSLRLGSNPFTNDLWISVEFHDQEFEKAVIAYIYRRLASRYRRLQGAPSRQHC